MRTLHSMDDFTGKSCAVALGTFDGVHLGHQKLIQITVQLAQAGDMPAAALTFDRHPLALIRPQDVPPPLTSRSERAQLLEALGLDVLIEQPFTQAFAAQSPEDYLRRIVRALSPQYVVVGFNHRFGSRGAGDADLIQRMASELHYEPVIVQPVICDGDVVSSTRIRELLSCGQEVQAERLLGHPLQVL